MIKLKEQLASLSENERLALAQELIESLSEPTFQRFFADFFSDAFNGRIKENFLQWLQTKNGDDSKKLDSTSSEQTITGDEMKAWIRQQIAESESKYAALMKRGEVKTYTLEEMKAEFNGEV